MLHIEHKGFVVDLVDCDAALSLNPKNKMEEVIAELLRHMKNTPHPNLPFEIGGNNDLSNVGTSWDNIRTLWRVFSWNPAIEDYTGYVMDGVIFAPIFLHDIHSPMRMADTVSHAAVDLDFCTGKYFCNEIGTADFIEKLSTIGKFWRTQAIEDHKLVKSGKLAGDDIESIENSLYSDIRPLM